MTMLDPKAMDTAREAWIASDVATRFFSDVEEHALQAAITAYISTITPAEVGGLVERLRNPADRYCTQSVREEAASLIQSQAARIAELEAGLSAAIQALEEAEEDVEHWGGYASEYFRDKHDLDGDLDRIAKQANAARALLNKEGRG